MDDGKPLQSAAHPYAEARIAAVALTIQVVAARLALGLSTETSRALAQAALDANVAYDMRYPVEERPRQMTPNPDDASLGPQVRAYQETPSLSGVVLDHFKRTEAEKEKAIRQIQAGDFEELPDEEEAGNT